MGTGLAVIPWLTMVSVIAPIVAGAVLGNLDEDVKNFFGQAKLPDPGFLANIDTSKLDGHYSLGLSRLYQGTLERCEQLAFPVTVRH